MSDKHLRSAEIRKNSLFELEITALSNLGYGIGRIGEMVVFVKGAVTGDIVRAKIIKVSKKYSVAIVEDIIKHSEHRCEDRCSAPKGCGGCSYRNIKYEYELVLKKEIVKDMLRKAGLADVSVGDVVSTGINEAYRNKAQYPVTSRDGKTVVGFYASGTHRVVEAEKCLLQPSVFSKITEFVCEYADKQGIKPYCEADGSGILRHIYIRQASATGEIMVCPVVTKDGSFGRHFADSLMCEYPEVCSVMMNINPDTTNVVLGDRYILLGGKPYIEDVLCQKRFRIPPEAFYQVNREGAERLYGIAAAKAELNGSQTLIDLYCGIGTIGISMSDKAKRVIGVEIVPGAVEYAKINAGINNIDKADFFCEDAGNFANVFSELPENSVVILDPPRKGCDPSLLEYIADQGVEKIVYVSCSPDTLARDISLLIGLGYIPGEVTPVDMFPRTGHVETIVCLCKQ